MQEICIISKIIYNYSKFLLFVQIIMEELNLNNFQNIPENDTSWTKKKNKKWLKFIILIVWLIILAVFIINKFNIFNNSDFSSDYNHIHVHHHPEIKYINMNDEFFWTIIEGSDMDKYENATLTIEEAKSIIKQSKHSHIHLDSLTQISSDVMAKLVKYNWKSLSFAKLEKIDKEIAKELAKFNWDYLYLDGITNLNFDEAKELAKFKWNIRLLWLKDIDIDVAKILKWNTRIEFDIWEITSIDGDLAKMIVNNNDIKRLDSLQLNKIKTIDKESARRLSRFWGWQIHLKWLEYISKDAAKELAKFNDTIYASEATSYILFESNTDDTIAYWNETITIEEAKKLASRSWNTLQLWIQTITPWVAKEIAKFKWNKLSIHGITHIDKETAKELAKFDGVWITIWTLDSDVDDDVIRELAKFNWWIMVNPKIIYSNDGRTGTDSDETKILRKKLKKFRLEIDWLVMDFWDAIEDFEKELKDKYPQSFQWIKYENGEKNIIKISFASYENSNILDSFYNKLDKESNYSWLLTVNLEIENKIYETCKRNFPRDEKSYCVIK